MGPDDVVEEMSINKTKVAINGCRSTAGKGPLRIGEVRQSPICVLKEGDRHCIELALVDDEALTSCSRLRTYPVIQPDIWNTIEN